jgi:hypothetical protein
VGITTLVAWAVAATLLALVLYPLSIGPTEWLWRHGYILDAMQPVVRCIYAPLIWLAEQSPPISEFLRQRIRFWNR